MPKLTAKINKENDSQTNGKENVSLSIKQTVKKDEPQTNFHTPTLSEIKETVKSTKTVSNIESADEISVWLINFIGKDIFEQLKENPHFQLPYTQENVDMETWLVKALKTIFPAESIKNIGQQIQDYQSKITEATNMAQSALSEKTIAEENLGKAMKRIAEKQDEIDDIESDKHRLKKQMQATVQIETLIEEFFENPNRDTKIAQLKSLLHESLDNLDDMVSKFVLGFSKGWFLVQNTIERLGTDEKQNMESIHASLTKLLQNISDKFIPQRRPLLDIVAEIVSEKFDGYLFVSPEQTLQIDPAMHNVQRAGSTTVREGVTFAVLRKETKKAVKYAEIIVAE